MQRGNQDEPVGGTARDDVVTCLYARGAALSIQLQALLSRGGVFEVDASGAGLIAWFERPSTAILAAISALKEAGQIAVGISTAEVSVDAPRSRLSDEARGLATLVEPGTVVVSLASQDLARHQLPSEVTFDEIGTRTLPTTRGPVRAFVVSHPGFPQSPLTPAQRPPWFGARFVGRRDELEELSEAVADSRLVAIVGPSGIGKSALVARFDLERQAEFKGGSFWVDLKLVSRPQLLVHRIAQALDIQSVDEATLVDQIVRRIGESESLLVLDDADLIPEGVSQVCEELISRCRNLTIMVTSSRRLDLSKQKLVRLHGLQVPAPGERLTSAIQYDAVHFLWEEAAAIEPTFSVNDDNLDAVRGIVEILEGSPWAIELAAARLALLPPELVLARLRDNPLTVLKDKSDPMRTRGLEASLSATLSLANPWAQALFRRLSVFSGPFDSDAVEEVCAYEPALPKSAALSALRDLHSLFLIRSWGSSRSVRAFYLSSIAREFASKLAHNSGECTDLGKRLDQYLADRVGAAVEELKTGRASALARFDLFYEDIREGWLKLLRTKRANEVVEAVSSVAPYWFQRGYYREALAVIDRVFDSRDIERCPSFCRLLVAATWISLRLGLNRRAAGHARLAVRTALKNGSDGYLPRALNAAASVAFDAERNHSACRLYRLGIDLGEAHLDPVSLRTMRMNLATSLSELGRLNEADEIYGALWREGKGCDWAGLQLINNIAHLRLVQKRIPECWDWLDQAVEQYGNTPDPFLLGQSYATAAWASLESGDIDGAGELYAAYKEILAKYGLSLNRARTLLKESLASRVAVSTPPVSSWDENEPTGLLRHYIREARKK